VLEDILAAHWKTLLIGDGRHAATVLLLFTPRNGKWVVCPESNSWHVQVGVLTWAERPRAGHANSDTKRIARENLYIGLGSALADVAYDKTSKAPCALHDPDGNDTIKHELLFTVLQVHPNRTERKGCTNDVAVQKHFVERVPDR
jgi:hypothetical protein